MMIHLSEAAPMANRTMVQVWTAEKKNLNLFSPPFFLAKQQKKIFKFIFSNVFPKTAEKKYLNLFSPTFFQKQEKK